MITMQEQQAEKSKLPEVVPPPNYTTQSSTKFNQRTHERLASSSAAHQRFSS